MSSAVEEHVIARIAEAPIQRLPSPYFYIEGIFPDDYYAELPASFPDDDDYVCLADTGRVRGDAFRERFVFLLKDAEIKAVIAYLQKASGIEVTVKIPSDVAETSEAARKPIGTPQEAIAEFGCTACHKVGGGEADLGPDLTRIGRLRDKAYIRRSILDPNADISQGFQRDTMPADYGTQMYAKELEMLVGYLAGLK